VNRWQNRNKVSSRGISAESNAMRRCAMRDDVKSLLKLKRDSVLRITGGSKVEAFDT
jgi:hypothetical protein